MTSLVEAALQEDVGPGDVTSLACLEPNSVKAEIVAKSGGVLSGLQLLQLTFALVDSAMEVRALRHDGDRFDPQDKIAEISGYNQPVLAAERTALNFLAHLSGIATLTSAFVEKVAGTRCRILDTRKTTPGWRLLEKQAVVHGGGSNHRLGLHDMILIKDNHIAAVGSVAQAVMKARQYVASAEFARQFGGGAKPPAIEVEVASEQQLREAIGAGAWRLLLDNQSIASLRRLVALAREIRPEVQLEASGNVNLDNIAQVAATGVDFVSIGALTHSAPASDFSMRIVG